MSQPEKPRRTSPIVQLGAIRGAHWVAAGMWVVAGGLRLIGSRPDWLAWACIGMAILTLVFYRSEPDPDSVTVPEDMRHQADAYRQTYVNQMRAGRGWQLALGIVFVLTGLAQLLNTVRSSLRP
jgi:hypothetical protein